jgi:hypothetical protein
MIMLSFIYYIHVKQKLLKLDWILVRHWDKESFSYGLHVIIINSMTTAHGAMLKLPLCLTNKALRHEGVWGRECIDPHFLGLGTTQLEVSGQLHAPAALPYGKVSRHTLDRGSGEPLSMSG